MWCEGLLYSYITQDCVILVELYMKSHISVVQNREPKIEPHKYVHLVYSGARTIQRRKDSFSTNGTEAIGHPEAKKNLDLNLTPFIKINSKCISE